ncbi:MAG: GNAT family N-acetyltransferase [Verrucomicrobiota bacterium]
MEANWELRQVGEQDQEFLLEMLYIALWDAPDEPRRPRSVLEKPSIKKFVEGWGRRDDFGLLAIDPSSDRRIGVIWARLDGYGAPDGFGCEYPCLGIAVIDGFQSQGVGSYLMSRFIEVLRSRVEGLRLGVHPRNDRAMGLYSKFGFAQYAIGGGGYPQMKLNLNRSDLVVCSDAK